MVEGRDWVAVVEHGLCPDCGLRAGAVDPQDLAGSLRSEASAWRDLLTDGALDTAALRRRPGPGSWSAVEYACHVRDVFAVFAGRVLQALSEDNPDFGWWDHSVAAVEEAYIEQDPGRVATDLSARAEVLAGALEGLPGDAWSRPGRRGDGASFTIAGLGRFALHESHHHRWDAGRAASAPAS